jgi:hypothetical protein
MATIRYLRKFSDCLWLLSTILFFSSLALAQRDLGTITGTLTDPSGAA